MQITNKMQQIFGLLIFLIQPYMFRATNSPILKSTFGLYTRCNRRNGPDFGRVFLRSNYTEI